VAIALTNQHFPPILPPRGEGSCIFIIRLEHGLLDELVNSFLEMVEGGRVPNGSAMVSVSHLAFIRTQSYTERVAAETSHHAAGLGGHVLVLPMSLVAWAGCNDLCVTRGLFDFNQWLGSFPGFSLGAAAAATSVLFQGRVGGLQPQYETVLSVLNSLSMWGKKHAK
jgi:hypothetical protein